MKYLADIVRLYTYTVLVYKKGNHMGKIRVLMTIAPLLYKGYKLLKKHRSTPRVSR